MEEETTLVAIRLETSLLERITRFAEKLEANNPGLKVSRTNAIKALLTRALNQEEIDTEPPSTKKKIRKEKS
jgi:hypothetical protein